MLLSLFYGMQSYFVLLWKYDLDFFLLKMSLFISIIFSTLVIFVFSLPSLSYCFSLYWHIFYLWHIVRFFSDDYKSPVFVDISLSKSWSDHKLPIEQKLPKKRKEDATKLMIERKKLTKLYNLKTFKSRNKHND